MTQFSCCELTERFPVLIHVQPDEREAWVAQAEAAIPLSREQLVTLGFCPDLVGVVLTPKNPADFTQAQLNALFPSKRPAVLSDILTLGLEVRDERSA